MTYVDLHTHSTASDGTFAPAAVVRLAAEAGLSAMALTDHDTVAGVAEAQAEAARLGIDFVTGIEISAEYPRPGTLHMLGYGIDVAHPSVRDLTTRLQAGRSDRNQRIIARLNEIGIPLTLDEVLAIAGGGVVGRPHFAQALIRRGVVSTVPQAFNEYLGQGGKAYLDKERLSAREAIALIHEAGGIAVLAHPVQLQKTNDAQVENEVKNLVDAGLDGIEVIHSDHRESVVDKLGDLARRFGLVRTGGSDFHGTNKAHIHLGSAGGRRVPRAFFDELLERLQRRR
jgi:predicted metal-dependent phosphoesterase TrpH